MSESLPVKGPSSGEASDAVAGSTSTSASRRSSMAWHGLPKPDGVRQYCSGAKVKIDTHRAIKVNMKVNVLEISAIDQVREVFTAIFTVQFFYIDPVLADFRTNVTYVDEDGKVVVERNCQLTGNWKYSPNGWVTILCESGQEKILTPTCIQHAKQPDWDADPSLFRPSFTFGNAVTNAEVFQHVRMLEYCSAAGGHVFEKIKFQGTFAESLELKALPFDRQMLRIRIYGEEPLWRQQIAAFKDGHAGRLSNHGGVPTEWAVDDNVVIDGDKVPSCRLLAWKRKDDSFRSTLDVVIHVKRVPTFVMWNIVVVNFALTLLTASAFACFPDEFSDRVNIQLLLLLTSVGYKVVTAGWLPTKSYLTLLDKYALVNFGIQALAVTESWLIIMLACVQIDEDDDDWTDGIYDGPYMRRQPPSRECWHEVKALERWFACGVYGFWILLHVVFFVAHKRKWTDRFFPSWNVVYKENGMDQPIIGSFDQHPYGFEASEKKHEDNIDNNNHSIQI